MGMKFATEISNIQRVGVILYMGMKSSINHQWVHSRRSYPLYGNEIDTKKSAFDEVPELSLIWEWNEYQLINFILHMSYSLYGNEIKNVNIIASTLIEFSLMWEWNRLVFDAVARLFKVILYMGMKYCSNDTSTVNRR